MLLQMLRTLALTLALFVAALPATAQTDGLRDRIVQELIEDGYREITVNRTFLRRLRFVGENERSRREIIVNPVTGVILRDYIRYFRLNDDAAGGVVGAKDDDDDDDYDEYDDDDEYDNSGSGSSNSGSGSSNSGSGSDDDDEEDD